MLSPLSVGGSVGGGGQSPTLFVVAIYIQKG